MGMIIFSHEQDRIFYTWQLELYHSIHIVDNPPFDGPPANVKPAVNIYIKNVIAKFNFTQNM